jgi:hypothetical protein
VSTTLIAPAIRAAELAPRPPASIPTPSLPAVAPGQLWLIEAAADGAELHALSRHALDDANVVIYDRSLADRVSLALPLGTYAEPAPARSDAAASRSVHFARDGWSVVRLLPARLPSRERTRRVQDIVDELAAAKVAGRLPVTIVTHGADGVEERIEARFDDLASIVASHPRDTLLTIVIDAFAGAGAARLHAVAANGLAG